MTVSEALNRIFSESWLGVAPELAKKFDLFAVLEEFPAGFRIVEQGASVSKLFIQLQGESVFFAGTGKMGASKSVGNSQDLEIIGLDEILWEKKTYNLSVETKSASVFLTISTDELDWDLKKYSEAHFELLKWCRTSANLTKFILMLWASEAEKKGNLGEKAGSIRKHLISKGEVFNPPKEAVLFMEEGFARVINQSESTHVYIEPNTVFSSEDFRHSTNESIVTVSDLLYFSMDTEKFSDEQKKMIIDKNILRPKVKSVPILYKDSSSFKEAETKLLEISSFGFSDNLGNLVISEKNFDLKVQFINFYILLGRSRNRAEECLPFLEYATSTVEKLSIAYEMMDLAVDIVSPNEVSRKGSVMPYFLIGGDVIYIVLRTELSCLVCLNSKLEIKRISKKSVKKNKGACLILVSKQFMSDEVRAPKQWVEGIINQFQNQWRSIYLSLRGLAVLESLFSTAIPIILNILIDEVLVKKQFSLLKIFVTGFLFVIVFKAIARAMSVYLTGGMSRALSFILSTYSVSQAIKNFGVGTKIQTDASELHLKMRLFNSISNISVGQVTATWNSAFVSTVSLLIIFFINWRLSVIALIYMLLIYVVSRYSLLENQKLLAEKTNIEKSGAPMLKTAVTLADEIVRSKQNATWVRKILDNLFKGHKIDSRVHLSQITINGMAGVIYGIFWVVITLTLLNLGATKQISPGSFIATLLCFGNLSAQAGVFIEWMKKNTIQGFSINYANSLKSVDAATNADSTKLKGFTLSQGVIRLQNVGFTYSKDRRESLRNISFTIKPGEVIAIIGRSGSGKSTLGKLISGLCRPTSGSLFYDDVPSEVISNYDIRRQVMYLEQKASIFPTTLLENIAVGDLVPDIKRVESALRLIGAEGLLNYLPSGLYCRISQNSEFLTLASKQQICLARLIYKDPKVIVVDEGTSSLDPESEEFVTNKIFSLAPRVTILFITQRLSTIRRADRILIMREGRLKGVGKHSELVENSRDYAELVKRQAGLD